jgi:hypothetical protein
MKLSMSLAAALAAATITVACNDAEPALEMPMDSPENAASEDSRDAAPASVRVNGCLQEADGDYVLTTASPAVNPERPGEPQGAQLEAARESYRLSGDDDSFEKMLGGRVQVTGLVEERADLPKIDRTAPADRSTDRSADRSAERGSDARPLDLDVSQLAQLTVTSITPTGEACGAGNARRDGN